MNKITSLGILTIVLLFTIVSPSGAKFNIVPSVSVLERYNDNIFLTESDQEDDFITIFSPKIILNYSPNKDLDINLDYGFNFRFYSRHSELNDTSIRETQRANLQAQARPFQRFYVDVSDVYRRVPEDIRSEIVPDNEFENMTDSNIFSVSPYIEFPFTSTILSRFGYRYTDTWFKSDEGNDSESHSIYTSLTKKFPMGLNVALNYNYIAYRPKLTDKYEGHQGTLSMDYQVSSDFKIWGGIGKTYIDFSSTSNEESDIWHVGSEYNLDILGGSTIRTTYNVFLSNTDIEIDARHYPDVIEVTDIESYLTESYFLRDRNSVSTGITETERFDLSITTKKHFDFTINPYYKEEDELETSRLDKITGIAVYIQKPLTTKLSVSLDGLWERQKFLPDDEKVKRYIAGGSFDYILSRSITTSIGYKYNERDAEAAEDDFRNNIVWVQATLIF